MKEKRKKWLRPALYVAGGAAVGLAYYYFVGCANGSCAITANPFTAMAYMGLVGWLLSGALGGCCSGGCRR